MARRPSKSDFWFTFQSEPAQGDMASRPSKFDFWRILWRSRSFQSEPGPRDMASRPSKYDFWFVLQSEPGQCDMASRPSKFDFGVSFLGNVRLPAGLQSLTLGYRFNQSLDNVTWPAGLQILTFRGPFNQPGQCEMASRPSKFDFGVSFQSEPGQSDMASGPSKFDVWRTFQSEPGHCEMASRPSNLTFDENFNQSLSNVTWPAGLQIWTFGQNFDQSLDNVAWPAGLQILTFGLNFDQSLDNVASDLSSHFLCSWLLIFAMIWVAAARMREWAKRPFHHDALLAHSLMRAEATKKIPVPLPGFKSWFDSPEVGCKSWSLAPQSRTFYPRPSKFDFWVFSCRKPESGMARRPSEPVLPPHWVSGTGLRRQWRNCRLGSCAQGSVAQEGRSLRKLVFGDLTLVCWEKIGLCRRFSAFEVFFLLGPVNLAGFFFQPPWLVSLPLPPNRTRTARWIIGDIIDAWVGLEEVGWNLALSSWP